MSKMLFIHILLMFLFMVMQRNTYACHLSSKHSNIYSTEATVLTFSVRLFIVLQRLQATVLVLRAPSLDRSLLTELTVLTSQ